MIKNFLELQKQKKVYDELIEHLIEKESTLPKTDEILIREQDAQELKTKSIDFEKSRLKINNCAILSEVALLAGSLGLAIDSSSAGYIYSAIISSAYMLTFLLRRQEIQNKYIKGQRDYASALQTIIEKNSYESFPFDAEKENQFHIVEKYLKELKEQKTDPSSEEKSLAPDDEELNMSK